MAHHRNSKRSNSNDKKEDVDFYCRVLAATLSMVLFDCLLGHHLELYLFALRTCLLLWTTECDDKYIIIFHVCADYGSRLFGPYYTLLLENND